MDPGTAGMARSSCTGPALPEIWRPGEAQTHWGTAVSLEGLLEEVAYCLEVSRPGSEWPGGGSCRRVHVPGLRQQLLCGHAGLPGALANLCVRGLGRARR